MAKIQWEMQKSWITKTDFAITIKVLALASTTLAMFSQDLIVIFKDALQSEITSYVLIIPLIFAYLIYRKRKMLRAVLPLQNQSKETRHLPTIAGILIFVTAILLYWYGSYTFTPLEYHMFTLPVFIAGLSLILFNTQTLRQLAFPIAFLAFIIPLPSEFLYVIGANLSIISSEISNAIVNMVGIPSIITSEYGNPAIIITRPNGISIPFIVDIACSGIYSLIGFLVFSTFIAYIARDKTWKKFALFSLGIPLIYLLNVTRITIILLLGYQFGEEIALQVFHLLGGWILVFLGTLLLLLISEKLLKTRIFTSPYKKCSKCDLNRLNKRICFKCGRIIKPGDTAIDKSGIVKISAVVMSVIILVSIQAPVFALTQSPAIVIINTPSGQQYSTEILPRISGYNLQFAYRDTRFEEIAKQDMSLAYLYTQEDNPSISVWATIEISTTLSTLHRWEICLINWPVTQGNEPEVTQIDLKDIQLTQNPPIISRYFVFNNTATGQIQAVLYWYELATFTLNSTSQREHVKISLIVYPKSLEELPQIENQLIAIAKPIIDYWQPIKTWSQISTIISQNGMSLASASSTFLVFTIIFYFVETKKQRKANKHAYLKLSKLNRQIIDAIQKTERDAIPTLKEISNTYAKKFERKIEEDQLMQKLVELEKTGITKSYIAKKHDEPIHIWKTQI